MFRGHVRQVQDGKVQTIVSFSPKQKKAYFASMFARRVGLVC